MMENETEWATIPVDRIDLSPFLVREYFSEEAMKRLAKGIEERGLLHPVTVRRVCDRYELLAGERRYRAVKEYLSRSPWQPVSIKTNSTFTATIPCQGTKREQINSYTC